MAKPPSQQLDKILAMADSVHDGEALVAVRKARQMLSRDGLNFSDLARAALRPRINLPFGLLSGQHVISLEAEIVHLRQELETIRSQKIAHETRAEHEKQRALDMEQKLAHSQTEAARWRQLARDTVEKLWDLGQAMEQDEPAEKAPAKTAKQA